MIQMDKLLSTRSAGMRQVPRRDSVAPRHRIQVALISVSVLTPGHHSPVCPTFLQVWDESEPTQSKAMLAITL